MKKPNLLIKIANLLLESDEASADWIHHAPLRRCFYLLSGLLGLLILNNWVTPRLFEDALHTSLFVTRLHRWSMFILCTLSIATTIITALYYFRYVLSKGARVYLQNILYFYICAVLYFALLYFYTFTLFPNSFAFQPEPISIAPTFTRIPSSVVLHFFMFSAFQSVNSTYFKIKPSSWLPSVIAYVQSLFTISLISLLVASYVNQKTKAKGA
jgi:hypothetical protein